jgi:hypothetical protein
MYGIRSEESIFALRESRKFGRQVRFDAETHAILLTNTKLCQNYGYLKTDGQSASLSWCQITI